MNSQFLSGLQQLLFPREEILKHWYTPVTCCHFSTNEFYSNLEREIATRELPGLEIKRIELSEGGMLSDKREYLRIKRERLVFDICAAPFGKDYFFSFRSVVLPLELKLIELLAILAIGIVVFALLIKLAGFFKAIGIAIAALFIGLWFLRNAIRLGIADIDTTLLRIPVIGAIYEVCFRKETYFRQDSRLMYLNTINSITEGIVEQVTLAKGIRLLKRFDRKPLHEDLYFERPNPLNQTSDSRSSES